MEFCDKLSFLMTITQTSNKELASEISVDRSLISLLRNGKRGMPRNRDHIKNMAAYFAKQCTAEYQRQAVAEMLGIAALRSDMPAEKRATHFEYWLIGEMDMVEHMVFGMHSQENTRSAYDDTESEIPAKSHGLSVGSPDSETYIYYGPEGKKQSYRHLFALMEESKRKELWLFSDSDIDWILTDYQFTKEIQESLKKRISSGDFRFRQILPPYTHLNSYTDTLKFMLPIYNSGHSEVYYYPRMQESIFFHTIIVVPGHCVLFGTSSRNGTHITMVSTSKEMVDANARQFEDHLSICRPALVTHTDSTRFYECFDRFFSVSSSIYQKVSPLSSITIPAPLLEKCIVQSSDPLWKHSFQICLDNIPYFMRDLKNSSNSFLDISHLATADQVRSGRIPIACPYLPSEDHPCYTPQTYILHLKNILDLMNEYENYTFVPISAEQWPGYNLIVNDGMAILIGGKYPSAMLEMRRPEMVQACQEHLLRIADRNMGEGMMREKIKIRIKTLIRELEE